MDSSQAETVTITKAELQSLHADRQLLGAMQASLQAMLAALDKRPGLDFAALSPGMAEAAFGLRPVPVPTRGTPSRIDRDSEVSAFIQERLGKVPLIELAALCRDRFGQDRAPSKSSIHRYWDRLSRQSGNRNAGLKTP